jgi:hypothetical protein
VELDREVAVGVPHHATRSERPHLDAALLPQLPAGRVGRSLADLDLAARELPETAEEAGGRPPLYEPAAAVRDDDHGGRHVGSGGAR